MKDTYIFAKSVLSDSPFLGQFKTSSWEIYDESKPIYIYLTICPFRSFPSVYHLSQLTKETPLYTSIRMKNGRGYIFKTSFSLDITKTNHGFVMESFSQKLNSRDKVIPLPKDFFNLSDKRIAKIDKYLMKIQTDTFQKICKSMYRHRAYIFNKYYRFRIIEGFGL